MFFQLEFDKFATIFRLFLLLELEKSELLATINFRILQKTCNHLFFVACDYFFSVCVTCDAYLWGCILYFSVGISMRKRERGVAT